MPMNTTLSTSTPAILNIANPYPGLRSFEIAESHLFFGREKQVDELRRKLRATRFLTVLGHSGSGKSSLVKCGLIPKLNDNFAAQAGTQWNLAMFRPGSTPFANLSHQLAQSGLFHEDKLLDANFATRIEQILRGTSLGLSNIMREYPLVKGGNLLIVIDQFEELLKLSKQDAKGTAEAQTFVTLLLNTFRQKNLPVYFVLTMRSDFLGYCTEFRGLPEVINDGQYLIPRMKRDEIKRAVCGPAEAHGAQVSQRLLNRLLDDVGDSADHLPLLQHAMMRTWDRSISRGGEKVTLELSDYEAIGTMANALSRHAEEAWADLNRPAQKQLCAQMFKTITELGEDNLGTRRPTKLNDLVTLLNAYHEKSNPKAGALREEEVLSIIEVFSREGRSFLTLSEDDDSGSLVQARILNISHESLMRVWGRLVKWVHEENDSAETLRKLAQAAVQYREKEIGLWVDPQLQLALDWRERQQPTAIWAQRYKIDLEEAMTFLDASKEERERKHLQLEEARQQKIRQARTIARISALACLIFLGLAFFAFQSYRAADKAKAEAVEKGTEAERQGKLAAINAAIASDQATFALQQKSIAEELKFDAIKKSEALELLSQDLQRQQGILKKTVASLEQTTASLEVSKKAEAEKAREAKENEKVAIQKGEEAKQNAQKAEMLRIRSAAQVIAVKLLKVSSPTVKGLLALEAYDLNKTAGGPMFEPYVYEGLFNAVSAQNNNYSVVPKKHTGSVNALVAFGNRTITASNDGSVMLWDFSGGTPAGTVLAKGTPGKILYQCAAISPSQQQLAVGNSQGQIELFSTNALGQEAAPQKVNAHPGFGINAMTFLRGNAGLVSAGQDGNVIFYDFKKTVPLANNLSVKALAAANNSTVCYAGTAKGSVLKWDLSRGTQPTELFSNAGSEITSIAVSPNDRYLAVGTRYGLIVLHDLENGMSWKITAHSSQTTALCFNSRSSLLVSGGLDKRAVLWEVSEIPRGDYQPQVFQANPSWVSSVGFSRNDEAVVTGCFSGEMRIYDIKPSRLNDMLCNTLGKNGAAQKMSETEREELSKYIVPCLSNVLSRCLNVPCEQLNPSK